MNATKQKQLNTFCISYGTIPRLVFCFSTLDKSAVFPGFFIRDCQSRGGGLQTYYLAYFWRKLHYNTRLHSSRMRTVCCSDRLGTGVSAGGVCLGGCLPRWSAQGRAVSTRGGPALGGPHRSPTTNVILIAELITARKRSLGQGNVFTPVCDSVHRGVSVPACTTGHMTGGQGGLCSGGSLSRGPLSRGVSVQGGLCPGGDSVQGVSVQGGLYPGGSLSRGSLSRGMCNA